MKTNAVVRIIIFSLIILLLLSILGIGIATNTFMFTDKTEGTVSSTGTADADTIRHLDIEWAAGTITIRPADVSAITLTETGITQEDPMVWIQAGNTLKVCSFKEDTFLHVSNVPTKDLLIEVPRDWSCDVLEIDTASADVVVENLTVGKVDFDGASGAFDFRDCAVDVMEIDTASGDLAFCGSLNRLDCDAASADCNIVLSNCPTSIEMDMASGDLDLTLPESCGFSAHLEALSGKLDTDFQVTHTEKGVLCGDGSCRIDMSAMSGNVYIHKGTEPWNCDH